MHCGFETFLARYCAPMLFGRKPATLLPEKSVPPDPDWTKLQALGFYICRLYSARQHVLLLIYSPTLLSAALSDRKVQQRLTQIGYPDIQDYKTLLNHLKKRFCYSNEFPHEVGFFLGYPPEDVIGFIDNRNSYKICGQWKVYSNEDRAAALFEEYDKFRSVLLSHIANGGTIFAAPALPISAG